MKKLIKISMIIITLALLCSCTSGVKETSSVSSDFNIVPSSQEEISSEETSSDSLDKTAKIVDEKYVRRAAEILSTKDLSPYYPKKNADYFNVAYEINFLDMTDDETPELIVNMSFTEKERRSFAPYVKSLIIDMDTAEVLSEFWGNCTGYDWNIFKRDDNKLIFLSASSIFSTINTRYFITEFENINGKLESNVKYAICQDRDYNRSNYFKYYFYENLTDEEVEELYFAFNPEDFQCYSYVQMDEYNKYIHSVMSAEDVEMINIGFYYISLSKKDGEITLFPNIKEPYKYIENDLKYPLS